MVRLDSGVAGGGVPPDFRQPLMAAAREVLGDYHGNVVADGYEPYQTVARAGPDGVTRYRLAFCWAHVRRKYVKAEPFAPTCAEVIELIGKLYEIERELPNPHSLTGAEQEVALAHILAVRRRHSARGRCDQGVGRATTRASREHLPQGHQVHAGPVARSHRVY